MSGFKKSAFVLAFVFAGLGFGLFEATKPGAQSGSDEQASVRGPKKNLNAKGAGATINRPPTKEEPANIVRNIAATSPLKDWNTARDPISGKIRTYSGGRIQLPGKDEVEKADGFVKSYSLDLFGVSYPDLAFAKSSKAARTKVTYQQTMSGFPVYGSTLSLLFDQGELQRVQNDLAAESPVPEKPDRKFEEVFELYRKKPNGGLRGTKGPIEKVELAGDPSLTPRLVLFPADKGLIFVYQFYVDETAKGRAPARAMVLFDPYHSRVVQKTDLHLE